MLVPIRYGKDSPTLKYLQGNAQRLKRKKQEWALNGNGAKPWFDLETGELLTTEVITWPKDDEDGV